MRSLSSASKQVFAQEREPTQRGRPVSAIFWLFALMLLGVVALAAPAQAAFPGANGRIAVTSIDWAWTETADVWSMSADGSAPVRLTDHPAQDFSPAFSPDGARIAFTSDRDGDQEIYVMNADGSGQTRLTTAAGNDTSPAFSADGSRVAFTSDRDGNQELYVIGVDGSGETRLTTSAANERGPAFSADGTRLAYSSDQDGDQEIYVMAPDGSNPTRLTDNAANDYDPTFAPDSLALAFTGNRDGGIAQVYVMNGDGSGQFNVSNDAASHYSYQPAFSPDGQRIALTAFAYCPPGHLCGAILNGGIRVRNRDGSGETLLDENGGANSEPDWGVAVAGAPPPPPPPPPDTTPPETAITSGLSGPASDTTPTFAFTGSDNASPAAALAYAFAVDAGAWSPYSADTQMTLGASSGLSEGSHTFTVKAMDEAGNEDPTPAGVSCFIDSVAPTGTVTINGGATRARTRTVTLTMSATDPSPGSGVTAMRISNTASGLSAAPWQPYATTSAWTLTSSAGTKTVHVQYRDAAANVSPLAQDTITYKP
jgi:dipeptidyl aminopeptidase/acylaminoacyl peptidase